MHSSFNDILWLQRDFGVFVVNLFDTYIASTKLDIQTKGLQDLWEKFCDFHFDKEVKSKFQRSDWRKRPLSSEQIKYAAADSYFLFIIYSQMIQQMSQEQIEECQIECNKLCDRIYQHDKHESNNYKKLLQKVATIDFDETNQKIFKGIFDLRLEYARKYDESVDYILNKYAMFQISMSKPQSLKELKSLCDKFGYQKTQIICQDIINIIQNPPEIDNLDLYTENPASQISKQKDSRKQQYMQNWTCKTPVYENCIMLAPDGQVLCHCDKKKVGWYLSRNLAQMVSEEPLTIKLNFEPTGRTYVDANTPNDSYYCQVKQNICVVCGATTNYLRYYVVPVLYRQHFPNDYKSHRSHDIVLLCSECHALANKHCDKVRNQLAKEYNVPLNIQNEVNQQKNELWVIRKSCLSLNQHNANMNESKKQELLQKIQETIDKYDSFKQQFPNFLQNQQQYIQTFSNQKEIDKIICNLNLKSKKRDSNLHGKLIVEKVGDIGEFIKRWRQHFLDSMKPKFLPQYWSVDHDINKNIGKFNQISQENQMDQVNSL